MTDGGVGRSTVSASQCLKVLRVLFWDYVHLWGETAAVVRWVKEPPGFWLLVQCRRMRQWGDASYVNPAYSSNLGSGASPSASKLLPGMRRPYHRWRTALVLWALCMV